jgi:peptide/nickel transport system substrate-binding protein
MACESDEFKDVRVRKAFNLAVDREAIIDNWLDGEGQAALNGFVPAMPNYPSEKVKGFVYNPAKAKALMAEAGYPNGKNFPALDFYVNTVAGSATHKTCQGIAKQIKENIGVDLNIKLCELSEREAAIQAGTAKIWRSGWIADYPDPENFLTQFYGGNISENATMVNSFKFRNETYDKLFSKAQTEIDPEKRIALLLQCDQMVIDQAATMPILTDDHIVMLNARVREFKASPLENINLTRVYIKEPKEEVAEN